MKFKPDLGWFLFFRRLGVKLGVVRKPLFTTEDLIEHRKRMAYRYRASALFCKIGDSDLSSPPVHMRPMTVLLNRSLW